MGWEREWRVSLAAASALGGIALPSIGAAQTIGVAAAVAGDVRIVVPGELPRLIGSGTEIRAGDQVVTGPNGSLQLLLTDQSAFTLGASSDLVIDRFSPAPGGSPARLEARASRGTIRYVAGGSPTAGTWNLALALPGGAVQAGTSSLVAAGRDDGTYVLANTGVGRDGAWGSGELLHVAGQSVKPGFAVILTPTGGVDAIARINIADLATASRQGNREPIATGPSTVTGSEAGATELLAGARAFPAPAGLSIAAPAPALSDAVRASPMASGGLTQAPSDPPAAALGRPSTAVVLTGTISTDVALAASLNINKVTAFNATASIVTLPGSMAAGGGTGITAGNITLGTTTLGSVTLGPVSGAGNLSISAGGIATGVPSLLTIGGTGGNVTVTSAGAPAATIAVKP